eukprot:1388923-Pyramimonas_sp.AAC.1
MGSFSYGYFQHESSDYTSISCASGWPEAPGGGGARPFGTCVVPSSLICDAPSSDGTYVGLDCSPVASRRLSCSAPAEPGGGAGGVGTLIPLPEPSALLRRDHR